MFATDVKENRRHRSVFGEFMAACGLVGPGDWVLTTHASGYLYRYGSPLNLLTLIDLEQANQQGLDLSTS